MRRLSLLFATASCISSGNATCPDGRICPDGTACLLVDVWQPATEMPEPEPQCVPTKDIAACNELEELEPCRAIAGGGFCHTGACFAVGCGNHQQDPGESCDDANAVDGDGCSRMCGSDETCGNGVIDPVELVAGVPEPREQCDDGDRVSHDGCSADCTVETPAWHLTRFSSPAIRGHARLVFDFSRKRFVGFGGALGPLNRDETFVGRLVPCAGGKTCVTWIPVFPVIRPPRRRNHAMAYDRARDRVVMYGGDTQDQTLRDLWEWDGDSWAPIFPPGAQPDAVTQAAMAYDPIHRVTVLNGGQVLGINPDVLAKTWEWNGTAWTETGLGLAPLSDHTMEFDPVRGHIVLVGMSANKMVTWHYDATNHVWVDMTPGTGRENPPKRTEAGLAWDAAARRVLLFGGVDFSTDPPTKLQDTWGWDGTNWIPFAAGIQLPQELTGISFASDPEQNRIAVFGGDINNSIATDTTMIWNGVDWEAPQVNQTATGVFIEHAATYDPIRDRMVVVNESTTFELAGSNWVRLASHVQNADPTVLGAALAYDAGREQTVMFGGRLAAARQSKTFIWNGTAWSLRSPTKAPTARDGVMMVYDRDRDRVVLFGGRSDAGEQSDTWEWDGTTWNDVSGPVASRPPPRESAAMGYDWVRHQIVVFGGAVSGTGQGDTLILDGASAGTTANWQLSTATGPIPRTGGQMAWNQARRRLVLFGGLTESGNVADTWEWDGEGWVEVEVADVPPARTDHTLTTSAVGVMVFGGDQGNDVWELRWDAPKVVDDRCFDARDTDGDLLIGCADPDCRGVCAPLCASQATEPGPAFACVAGGATCGDGVCEGRENCRICDADCDCTLRCGDTYCDPGETECPGDCGP